MRTNNNHVRSSMSRPVLAAAALLSLAGAAAPAWGEPDRPADNPPAPSKDAATKSASENTDPSASDRDTAKKNDAAHQTAEADETDGPKVVVHNAGAARTPPAGTVRISMPGRGAVVYRNGVPYYADASAERTHDAEDDAAGARTTPGGGIVIPSNTLGPGEPLWMSREREARAENRADLIAAGIADGYAAPSTYTVSSVRRGGLGWDGIGWTYFPNRYTRHVGPRPPLNTEPRPIPTGDLTEQRFGEAQREAYRASQPARVVTDPKTGLWVHEPR